MAMDFELSEEQRAYAASAREFAQSEFRPHAAQWDEESIFPKAALKPPVTLALWACTRPSKPAVSACRDLMRA